MYSCVLERHTDALSLYGLGNFVMYDPNDPNLDHVLHKIGGFIRSVPDMRTLPRRVIWQRVPGQRFPSATRAVIKVGKRTMQHKRGWVVRNTFHADGVIIEDQDIAVAFTSRDCPYLALECVVGGKHVVLVLHCGRDQLHNFGEGKIAESVIANAMTELSRMGKVECMSGVITLGISPEHFPNERYQDLTEALSTAWGESVIQDKTRHTIDLVELILCQLEKHGIPRRLITHDALDTFTDTRLASMRANRGGHNLLIAFHR